MAGTGAGQGGEMGQQIIPSELQKAYDYVKEQGMRGDAMRYPEGEMLHLWVVNELLDQIWVVNEILDQIAGAQAEPMRLTGEPPDMVCVETMLDTLVAAIVLSSPAWSNTTSEGAVTFARQLRFKAEEMERYSRENKKA